MMLKDITAFQKLIAKKIATLGGYSERSPGEKLVLNSLALAGEVGEIANKIKKHVWYSPSHLPDLREYIKTELGDVMYHVVQLATESELTMEEVLSASIAKATARNSERRCDEAEENTIRFTCKNKKPFV